jgi:hypothetical protein
MGESERMKWVVWAFELVRAGFEASNRRLVSSGSIASLSWGKSC